MRAVLVLGGGVVGVGGIMDGGEVVRGCGGGGAEVGRSVVED